jgi:transposase InsO family protein
VEWGPRLYGSAGNPYDDATIESFMKTVKYEEIYAREYTTVDDVIRRLPHFLEELYQPSTPALLLGLPSAGRV